MSRLSTVTEYWDKTPRNHKQHTFILLSHAIVVRRNSGGFRIVVSSLVCSLHEKMLVCVCVMWSCRGVIIILFISVVNVVGACIGIAYMLLLLLL